MTPLPATPDRGYTNPQRLLPDGSSLEEIRRAFNRVYDQLDRFNQNTTNINQTINPSISPSTPGGIATITPGSPNGGAVTPTGGATTGGGTGTTPVTPPRVPVTFYTPANSDGVLSIDSEGYVAITSVTI